MNERNNTEKSIQGNTDEKRFLNTISDSHKLKFADKPFKKKYSTGKKSDNYYKAPDVVFTLENKTNIDCICEYTISSREDRMSGKQYQAELVKKALKKENKSCIYTVVVPDDEYYGDKPNSKNEINNNNRSQKKINQQLVFSHIDFLLKESQVEEFFVKVQECRSKDAKYIVKNFVKHIKNSTFFKVLFFYY